VLLASRAVPRAHTCTLTTTTPIKYACLALKWLFRRDFGTKAQPNRRKQPRNTFPEIFESSPCYRRALTCKKVAKAPRAFFSSSKSSVLREIRPRLDLNPRQFGQDFTCELSDLFATSFSTGASYNSSQNRVFFKVRKKKAPNFRKKRAYLFVTNISFSGR